MKYTSLLLLAICSTFGIATVSISAEGGIDCRDLIAGQTIDAGEVCVEVIASDLVVTYTTQDGWELVETHVWVGLNLGEMPQTRRGNPRLGHFPYVSGDITGATTWSVAIPLSSLGDEADLCDTTFFLVTHAALRKVCGDGSYQTETGYGSGDRIVERGNWAMYYSLQFSCESTPPPAPPSGGDCETAWAFGGTRLWDVIDPATGDPITNKWGWMNVVSAGTLTQPLYAGAGQNDVSKGTYVGDLIIDYDGSSVSVTYEINAPYFMEETHLYVGTIEPDTAAPGQLGHLHDLDRASFDSYVISVAGDPIYIAAHAVVCGF